MANSPKVLTGYPTGTSNVKLTSDTSENFTTLEYSSTSVGTSATAITIPDTAQKIVIKHLSQAPDTLWISTDSGVTTTTGWPLVYGESLLLDIEPGQLFLYGITSTGTITIHVLGLS